MFEYNPDKHYPTETESRVVIRFQDCDPLRHLNNAKYFDYFFNAREDQVPKLYGLEIIDLIKTYKAAWVVYNHNISYVKPAMIGEWVRIMSRILWHNHNTIVVEYYMTDDSKTQVKTVLWSTMRYVTLAEGKSMIDAIKFGCAASALSVQKLGAQPSIPNRQEINEFLHNIDVEVL